MDSLKALAAAALLTILAGCGDGGAEENAAAGGSANTATPATNVSAPSVTSAAAPGGGEAEEKVLKTETVEAVFTGWEMGDYVWANLDVKGRETTGAWVGPTPLEHFLEAHKGKPLTVRIDTVKAAVPEAGGEMEVAKIADARLGALTAAAWWEKLSPAERQAAEKKMEDILGGSGG
jgi:hypothetical protein